MRLSTSTNILFERIGLPPVEQTECIRLCAEAGFKVMDFCFQDLAVPGSPFTGNDWERYIEKIAALAEELHIEFSQAHGIVYDFCRPEAQTDHQTMKKLLDRCVRASARLGVKWLVLHPSTDESGAAMVKNSKARNIDFFRPLLDTAGARGVGIALENMWELNVSPKRRYAVTAEELTGLVDALGEGAGICWDFEHGSIMQQNQGAALKLIGKRLKATHISDQTGLDNIHILPYLGVSDWEGIIEALADINYEGDFTYEAQWFLRRVPLELVPESLKYAAAVGNHLIRRFENAQARREAPQCPGSQ
jgi:sugar phosphate isomerase/epimerase